MAVTSKELHTPRGASAHSGFAGHAESLSRPLTPVSYVVTLFLAVVAVYVLVSAVVNWGALQIDDLRYGRPRTTHLEGMVGHEGAAAQPTHFVAMNLNGQVVVLELVGGDPNNVRSLPGPYLFGADGALTPVLLSLKDADGDGKQDLLLDVRREQVVYLNKDGAFRLPNAEEQRHLAGTP